jgi:hypothetical protein
MEIPDYFDETQYPHSHLNDVGYNANDGVQLLNASGISISGRHLKMFKERFSELTGDYASQGDFFRVVRESFISMKARFLFFRFSPSKKYYEENKKLFDVAMENWPFSLEDRLKFGEPLDIILQQRRYDLSQDN